MLEGRIQRTFEAVQRKDLDAVMAGWAEDGVLEFPGTSSLAGRYVGRPAIESFFARWFARMASIRLTVRHVAFSNPIALTYDSTMYVEFETDQRTTEGLPLHTEVVGVYRLRRGKLLFYREYLFDQSQAEEIWGRRQPTAA